MINIMNKIIYLIFIKLIMNPMGAVLLPSTYYFLGKQGWIKDHSFSFNLLLKRLIKPYISATSHMTSSCILLFHNFRSFKLL